MSSEWPQFTGNPRVPDTVPRSDRRTVTNPNLTFSAPSDDISSKIIGNAVSATPLVQQTSQSSTHSHNKPPISRRGSPHSLLENLSTTRSVPATPMGLSSNGSHLLKTPGTPHTSEIHALITTPNSHQLTDSSVNAGDLQASLSRLPAGPYESSLTFNSTQPTGREDVRSFVRYVHRVPANK
jgi:hypothetical protein